MLNCRAAPRCFPGAWLCCAAHGSDADELVKRLNESNTGKPMAVWLSFAAGHAGIRGQIQEKSILSC